ncbi:MAG: hypothetical protein FJ399_10470 [Verrucomicrobia bacterium]|nr:hypothetical protein [Verrucomicrobiota bacterium]
MRLLDLSHPLVHGAAAFPNDPKLAIVPHGRIANLDALPDAFTFAGFPLNFAGRDGSPIRAVAICPD